MLSFQFGLTVSNQPILEIESFFTHDVTHSVSLSLSESHRWLVKNFSRFVYPSRCPSTLYLRPNQIQNGSPGNVVDVNYIGAWLQCHWQRWRRQSLFRVDNTTKWIIAFYSFFFTSYTKTTRSIWWKFIIITATTTTTTWLAIYQGNVNKTNSIEPTGWQDLEKKSKKTI